MALKLSKKVFGIIGSGALAASLLVGCAETKMSGTKNERGGESEATKGGGGGAKDAKGKLAFRLPDEDEAHPVQLVRVGLTSQVACSSPGYGGGGYGPASDDGNYEEHCDEHGCYTNGYDPTSSGEDAADKKMTTEKRSLALDDEAPAADVLTCGTGPSDGGSIDEGDVQPAPMPESGPDYSECTSYEQWSDYPYVPGQIVEVGDVPAGDYSITVQLLDNDFVVEEGYGFASVIAGQTTNAVIKLDYVSSGSGRLGIEIIRPGEQGGDEPVPTQPAELETLEGTLEMLVGAESGEPQLVIQSDEGEIVALDLDTNGLQQFFRDGARAIVTGVRIEFAVNDDAPTKVFQVWSLKVH